MSRLRTGEWYAATGAVLLLVSLFAMHWYGPDLGRAGWWTYPSGHAHPPTRASFELRGALAARSGWQAVAVLRWFALATALAGLALAIVQAVVAAPGLPVTLDMLGMLVAGLSTILIAVRLATTGAPLRFGAVLGLFGAGLVAFGAFRAFRAESGWIPDPGDPERTIELVELGPVDGS